MAHSYRVDFALTAALSGPATDRFVFSADRFSSPVQQAAGHTRDDGSLAEQASIKHHAGHGAHADDADDTFDHIFDDHDELGLPVSDHGLIGLASTWKFSQWHDVPLF